MGHRIRCRRDEAHRGADGGGSRHQRLPHAGDHPGYWRQEQLLWQRLAELDPERLGRLRAWARVQGAGWALALAALVAPIHADLPRAAVAAGAAVAGALVAAGAGAYLARRPEAARVVWPAAAAASRPAAR